MLPFISPSHGGLPTLEAFRRVCALPTDSAGARAGAGNGADDDDAGSRRRGRAVQARVRVAKVKGTRRKFLGSRSHRNGGKHGKSRSGADTSATVADVETDADSSNGSSDGGSSYRESSGSDSESDPDSDGHGHDDGDRENGDSENCDSDDEDSQRHLSKPNSASNSDHDDNDDNDDDGEDDEDTANKRSRPLNNAARTGAANSAHGAHKRAPARISASALLAASFDFTPKHSLTSRLGGDTASRVATTARDGACAGMRLLPPARSALGLFVTAFAPWAAAALAAHASRAHAQLDRALHRELATFAQQQQQQQQRKDDNSVSNNTGHTTDSDIRTCVENQSHPRQRPFRHQETVSKAPAAPALVTVSTAHGLLAAAAGGSLAAAARRHTAAERTLALALLAD